MLCAGSLTQSLSQLEESSSLALSHYFKAWQLDQWRKQQYALMVEPLLCKIKMKRLIPSMSTEQAYIGGDD